MSARRVQVDFWGGPGNGVHQEFMIFDTLTEAAPHIAAHIAAGGLVWARMIEDGPPVIYRRAA